MRRDREAAEGARQLQVQNQGVKQGGGVLQQADQREGGNTGQFGEAPAPGKWKKAQPEDIEKVNEVTVSIELLSA